MKEEIKKNKLIETWEKSCKQSDRFNDVESYFNNRHKFNNVNFDLIDADLIKSSVGFSFNYKDIYFKYFGDCAYFTTKGGEFLVLTELVVDFEFEGKFIETQDREKGFWNFLKPKTYRKEDEVYKKEIDSLFPEGSISRYFGSKLLTRACVSCISFGEISCIFDIDETKQYFSKYKEGNERSDLSKLNSSFF